MFAVPLLSKAFKAISGAVTPSQQKVARQKLEIPAAIEHEVMDSFLGSDVIHYEILEPRQPNRAPVHPNNVMEQRAALHDFWLARMPTSTPT